MLQYFTLVLFCVEKSSHGICMHSYIFACIFLICEFGAIILCVDFGANSDCGCEDCCYSQNYQGKWCFMFLSLYFYLCIRNILYRTCMIILLSIYMICLRNPSSYSNVGIFLRYLLLSCLA